MKRFRLLILTICAIAIVGIQQALASGSGGFRDESPDAAAMGMGSAFVGQADTPAAVYYNPAGINQIQNIQFSAGGAFIAPRGSYKDNSGQVTQMRNNEFIVPHFYGVVPINQKIALGFGTSSYWGLGTEWAQDSFSKYVATKSQITNIDSMITLSYRLTDNWSVAVSADNDDSKVDLDKALDNFISADGNIKLKAKDNAWGFRLATLFKINDQNQIGLMYRSPIQHKYTGNIYIDGIDTAVYGAYGFTASSYHTQATEKLTLPQSIVMGYSFKPTSRWTINMDIEWMNWSAYKQDLIGYPDAPAGIASFLNTGNPTPRNWHSAFSESIGVQYAATDKLRLRAGYYHHGQVIPQGTLQTSTPNDSAQGATAGLGYDFSQHLTLDVGYAAQFYQARKVNNNVGSTFGANISGKYMQFVNDGLVTLTYKF